MIVVSNTSPLNYLVLIDAQDILPALYGRVLIPSEVYEELREAPPEVQRWLATTPNWLEVRKAPQHSVPPKLHPGEAAAIALAKEFHASLLLIDDDAAYRYAAQEGLPVTRTVAVLRDAAAQNLIDLSTAFDKLKQTNFRVSHAFLDEILQDFAQKQAQESQPTHDPEQER